MAISVHFYHGHLERNSDAYLQSLTKTKFDKYLTKFQKVMIIKTRSLILL